jgi:hypothetical protein
MAYVVYDTRSAVIVTEKSWGRGSFKTESAAKAARTRMIRRRGWQADALAVADSEFYNLFIRRSVKRVNLMSGLEYYEDVNTPSHCSPASEAYWSF